MSTQNFRTCLICKQTFWTESVRVRVSCCRMGPKSNGWWHCWEKGGCSDTREKSLATEIGEMTPKTKEPAAGDGKDPPGNQQRGPDLQKELEHLVSQVKRGPGTVISSCTLHGNSLGLYSGVGNPILYGSLQPENNERLALCVLSLKMEHGRPNNDYGSKGSWDGCR